MFQVHDRSAPFTNRLLGDLKCKFSNSYTASKHVYSLSLAYSKLAPPIYTEDIRSVSLPLE